MSFFFVTSYLACIANSGHFVRVCHYDYNIFAKKKKGEELYHQIYCLESRGLLAWILYNHARTVLLHPNPMRTMYGVRV